MILSISKKVSAKSKLLVQITLKFRVIMMWEQFSKIKKNTSIHFLFFLIILFCILKKNYFLTFFVSSLKIKVKKKKFLIFCLAKILHLLFCSLLVLKNESIFFINIPFKKNLFLENWEIYFFLIFLSFFIILQFEKSHSILEPNIKIFSNMLWKFLFFYN